MERSVILSDSKVMEWLRAGRGVNVWRSRKIGTRVDVLEEIY